jgi:hypothetical protein
LALIAAMAAAAAVATATPAGAAPPVKHVFIVVMENKGYSETFGPDTKAPFLGRELPAAGALLQNYYATGHLSLDNYVSMVSGQGPNPVTQADCPIYQDVSPGTIGADGQASGTGCVYPASVKTIANQLEDKNLTWKGYMEDMANGPAGQAKSCRHPALNSMDSTQSAKNGDQYAARHNPFVYFHSITDTPSCAKNDVDFSELSKDMASAATAPSYSFITPNLCNDGHDAPCVDGQPGGLTQIDKWLHEHVPQILASPGYKDNGLLIVTFDEAENSDATSCCGEKAANTPNAGGPTPGPGGGKIGAVAISPFVKPGTIVQTAYNHYSLLRSTEDLFGLSHLGYANASDLQSFGGDVFNRVPRLFAKVSPRKVRVARGARASTIDLKRTTTLKVSVNRPAEVTLGGACLKKTGQTDEKGSIRFRLKRVRSAGRCTVVATREGWSSARKTIRVHAR